MNPVETDFYAGRRVLVTGGAGFVGSHLCEVLLTAGATVVVLDNFATGNAANLPVDENLTFQHLDVRQSAGLDSVMADIDYVFHLATANVRLSLNNPTIVHDTNATGTLNVLKAAASAGVDRLLYCSSSEVYGSAPTPPVNESAPCRPTTIYGASKLLGEHYARIFHQSGWLPCAIARPHNAYGPRAHFDGNRGELIPRLILLALAGRPLPIFGDGNQTRDFTFVHETAATMASMLAHDQCIGEVANICRGEGVAVRQIAELVIRLTGSTSTIEALAPRPNDIRQLHGDNSLLKQLLGTVPRVGIEAGLIETIAWYREHVNPSSDLLERLASANWDVDPPEAWLPEAASHP